MEAATRLGQRLRARRSALGLTLMAVAVEAGLSVPYVANLEKGRGNPTLDVIVGLAGALGVDAAELLVGNDGASGHIDEALVDLAPVLVDYSRGKLLRAQTEWMAAMCQLPPGEMRLVLLRAMAAAPRPQGRALSKKDCGRLLDAYALILTDPGDT